MTDGIGALRTSDEGRSSAGLHTCTSGDPACVPCLRSQGVGQGAMGRGQSPDPVVTVHHDDVDARGFVRVDIDGVPTWRAPSTPLDLPSEGRGQTVHGRPVVTGGKTLLPCCGKSGFDLSVRGDLVETHGLPAACAGRDQTVYGALARAEALAAGDPDWMNCKQWPKGRSRTFADALQVALREEAPIHQHGHQTPFVSIDAAARIGQEVYERLTDGASLPPCDDCGVESIGADHEKDKHLCEACFLKPDGARSTS